jgi:predicted nucleic acid-binding protein
MEALACEVIFKHAFENKVKLIWSFMHELENDFCPIEARKLEILRLSEYCQITLPFKKTIEVQAQKYVDNYKISSKDAVHLSCAINIKAGFFITCDDILLKRSNKIGLNLKILNPVDYVR